MKRAVLLAFWVFFMGAALIRNLPDQVALRRFIIPIDTYILSKLAFYHRGWGMFPGPTTSTMEMRLRYDWSDQDSTYITYFPYRSKLTKSVWNEVMEDLGVRMDNGDSQHQYLQGFFRYQCLHEDQYPNDGNLPIGMAVEITSIPLHEILTNYGRPYSELKFREKFSYNCRTNEFQINK